MSSLRPPVTHKEQVAFFWNGIVDSVFPKPIEAVTVYEKTSLFYDWRNMWIGVSAIDRRYEIADFAKRPGLVAGERRHGTMYRLEELSVFPQEYVFDSTISASPSDWAQLAEGIKSRTDEYVLWMCSSFLLRSACEIIAES